MSERKAGYTTRRFHEPLDDALDRPIAFNPAFKRLTGSTVAALMLSQAWYWSKRTSDESGWFYKTVEEWEEETGLTRSEQETARKHLKRFMEIDLRGVPARLYYRLNKEEIYSALGVQFAETLQSSLPEPRELDSDIPANINIESETTTEITTSDSQKKAEEPKKDLVDGILDYHIRPKAIQDAIRDYFKLTPNWDAKYNKQFMEWAVESAITAAQIQHAAGLWRSDKRFNWQVPSLKGIQEHWLELVDTFNPEGKTYAEPDKDGGYY